jgi:hypothetical protein
VAGDLRPSLVRTIPDVALVLTIHAPALPPAVSEYDPTYLSIGSTLDPELLDPEPLDPEPLDVPEGGISYPEPLDLESLDPVPAESSFGI